MHMANLSKDIWLDHRFVPKSSRGIILCASDITKQVRNLLPKDNLILGDSPIPPLVEWMEDLFQEKVKGKDVLHLLQQLGLCLEKVIMTLHQKNLQRHQLKNTSSMMVFLEQVFSHGLCVPWKLILLLTK